MARKLKVYVTTSGFFEAAVAAPSMKAAAELLDIKPSAFAQGFAHETEEAGIVSSTTAKPGVVLRRAVGTKGKFSESAALPKLSALQDAIKHTRVSEPRRVHLAVKKPKGAKPKTTDGAASRKAAQLYDIAEKRRQKERRGRTPSAKRNGTDGNGRPKRRRPRSMKLARATTRARRKLRSSRRL